MGIMWACQLVMGKIPNILGCGSTEHHHHIHMLGVSQFFQRSMSLVHPMTMSMTMSMMMTNNKND